MDLETVTLEVHHNFVTLVIKSINTIYIFRILS